MVNISIKIDILENIKYFFIKNESIIYIEETYTRMSLGIMFFQFFIVFRT